MADKESVEKICNQIREDGEKEIKSILDKAEQTASGILESAGKDGEEAAGKIMKEAKAKGEIEHRRLLSSVSIEVRRTKLKAREEVISKIGAKVEERLKGIREDESYIGILAGLVAEAVRALDGGVFQVSVDRRDLKLLEEKVFPRVIETMRAENRQVEKLDATVLEEKSIGGARVGVPGGKVIYDNTFEARMYRMRDDTRNIIFKEVFYPEGSEDSDSA